MKRKVVKAWALIENGTLIVNCAKAPVYWLKSAAKPDSELWEGSELVPCTISYELPRKARKKV